MSNSDDTILIFEMETLKTHWLFCFFLIFKNIAFCAGNYFLLRTGFNFKQELKTHVWWTWYKRLCLKRYYFHRPTYYFRGQHIGHGWCGWIQMIVERCNMLPVHVTRRALYVLLWYTKGEHVHRRLGWFFWVILQLHHDLNARLLFFIFKFKSTQLLTLCFPNFFNGNITT